DLELCPRMDEHARDPHVTQPAEHPGFGTGCQVVAENKVRAAWTDRLQRHAKWDADMLPVREDGISILRGTQRRPHLPQGPACRPAGCDSKRRPVEEPDAVVALQRDELRHRPRTVADGQAG